MPQVADMGYTMWGPIGREVVGILYIIAYVTNLSLLRSDY